MYGIYRAHVEILTSGRLILSSNKLQFVNSHPLHAKSADEVLDAVRITAIPMNTRKESLQTMKVNFAMRNSNHFARKLKSSRSMERQELQPQQNMERKYEVNNYGVK